ncbi:MEDS domain-containing protein [Actinoplanes sp. HUAS TT8]|uniref:MEDS domain-containing protein n=1 Tax=Actinoplanes sp. HUAS TT8 TaxID=3447453 RepID=UPI003F51D731
MAEASLLDHLGPGDHACLVYDDEPLWAGSVASLVRSGLRRHHRIVYCGPDAERLPSVLAGQGVDITMALSSGQLTVAGVEAAYLPDGVFDPEASLAAWAGEVATARAQGYHGMRGIGDMTWARRDVRIDQLSWYEARVNRICVDGYTTGVCLYDRREFSEPELRRVTRTHPSTITRYTDPSRIPLLRVVRTGGSGLRLSGEADLSNRQALRAMVEHLVEEAADREPVTLDLSDLRFADSAAARILLEPAVSGGHRLDVVGCSRSLRRLLAFHWDGPTGRLRLE